MKLKSVVESSILSVIIYYFGRMIFTPKIPLLEYDRIYTIHAILFFLAFLIVPVCVLIVNKENLSMYSGLKGFLLNMGVYISLAPVVVMLFDSHLGTPLDFASLTLTAMNVSSVDFFVHRIYQLPFEVEFGEEVGVLTAVVVWLVFHIPEAIYLSNFSHYSFVFVLFTGVLFSLTYTKTKDILGLMFGHIVLNIIISVF